MAEITYPNRAAAMRAKLLGQSIPPPQKLVIDGDEYWIRAALMEDQTKIGEVAGLAMKALKDGTVDLGNVPMTAMISAAAIVLAVDEQGNQIFTPVDLPTMVKARAGGWIEKLGTACIKAARGESVLGEASGEAPAGASPSTSPIA
jgi:hypothetical protein